jgi:crotonobetaine/carnitine-CoA ligase
MLREKVLAEKVPPVAERRRQIESERLPENLGALLDETAAAVPDQLAWHFFESDETITYAALRAAVNRLANGLRAIGAGKGAHVGVMLPNVAAFPITWLAIARLGAVMIPVNARYTGRELHYVLDDGEADFLVIDEAFLPALDEVAGRLPRLGPGRVIVRGAARPGQRSWSGLSEGQSADFAGETPARDDLLNIQYTSGTTGFPKGCLLTQRYWLTIGKVNARRDGRVYKRILAATPFFYMDPQWLLLMSFYQRGTLYVAARQSASRFMEWVRRYRINFTLFPELAYKQKPTPQDPDNEIVRVNMYGVRKEFHADVERRFAFVAREAFGMTEIGSGMFMPIEATDMVGSGSCGIPAPFRECRVADPDGNTVPPGTVGELLVRGPGILLGYYRKPEATAAAFHGDWFRTGDLFRQDERGYLYIVGRVKDMIRRAGENIAAREVEAVLCQLPEIAEAAAVPVPDETRGEEVKAYVVLQPGVTPGDVPPERIVAHCSAGLASFKVPRYLEYRPSLPKTPSEKIAKHVLKQESPDLRRGSWDRVDGRWIPA